ncbi:hypothetical protein BABINDRAFT_84720 [Babjeviella inositovora NRRL Y-12698]|uniref:Ribosome biogenesis protein NSA1 n=1 Tax=Babjeviella inositovora NRRL Y-12698 TaxID=984486 RepID=A0A1E3QLX3_9ASCO|nr:uncharacterized protein BABINDRAFT_84720 [Babjeviella inositovora NRRL Y-12698]ODQ78464.1 hypothetical protein BABINDRAFT_84720 [Babjeviella inositovora NRRL Y-12698]
MHKLRPESQARFSRRATPFNATSSLHPTNSTGASPIAHVVNFTRKGRQYVAISYHDAILQLYCRSPSLGSPNPRFELIKQWPAHVDGRNDCIIGLVYSLGLLYTCSSRGNVVVRNLDDDDCNFSQISVVMASGVLQNVIGREGKGLVLVFRVCPTNPKLIAVAGQRLGVTLVELSLSLPVDSYPRERVVWRSKAERDIWIGDVGFLGNQGEGHKLVASTRFGRVMLYHTAKSESPIADLQVSHHPILAIKLLPGILLYQDSYDLLGLIDLESFSVTDEFHIPLQGSLSCLEVVDAQGPTVLVSTLDRRLKLVRLGQAGRFEVLDSVCFNAQVRQVSVFPYQTSGRQPEGTKRGLAKESWSEPLVKGEKETVDEGVSDVKRARLV